MTTLIASLQSGHLARRAAAGAANSRVTPELGKCVVSKSSKVSPLDCVCLPVGATKEPSLILGSLERALCNLADLGRSSMELQKALQVLLRCLPYLLPVIPLNLSVEVPTMWILI